MNSMLKDNLLNLKSKLEGLEDEFETKLQDVEKRSLKYNQADENIQKFISENDKTLKLNIGGKIYLALISTLANIKDNLFYSIIRSYLDEGKELPEEIFIDRHYNHFSTILTFMKLGKTNLKGLDKKTKDEILEEMKFYGIDLNTCLKGDKLRLREFIPEGFWISEDKIVIKGWFHKYLRCYSDGRVQTDCTGEFGQTEMLTPEIDSENYISFKTHFETYLSDNNESMNAVTVTEPGELQKFKVIKTLKTETGKGDGWGVESNDDAEWIVWESKGKSKLVSDQGNGQIQVNRTAPGPWEKFYGKVLPQK